MAFRGLHTMELQTSGPSFCVEGWLLGLRCHRSLWGYLDARKRPHTQARRPATQSVAFPSTLAQAHSAGSLHLQPPRTTATKAKPPPPLACPRSLPRPGVPQCSPARGWRWGPCQGPPSLPPVPCDAWRVPAASLRTSPGSPSLSPGSQLASVASFFSLAIPSLSPPGTLHLLFLPHPPPQCPRNTLPQTFPDGWFPTLQGSTALPPPLREALLDHSS